MTGDLVPAERLDALQSGPAYTERDFELSDRAVDRVHRAITENTRRAYRRWVPVYEEWCDDVGRIPYPGTPATLAEFVSMLADAGKGPPSIKIAIAAVRAQHAMLGFEGHPATRPAMRILRTHARDHVDDGARGKQATPILLPALRKMLATCATDTYRGRRDRLVLVLGWAGMFRRSELAAMLARDVRPAADGVDVFIPRSKTDRDSKGETVHIPAGEQEDTDVVRNLHAYRRVAADLDVRGGHLFRAVTIGGRITGEITGDGINDIVHAAARAAGLPNPGGYSAHGLRSGGASWSYEQGKPIAEITAQGRWSKNSPVVLSYIRAVDRRRNNAMKDVGM